jgi:hypothetical protein
MLLDSVELGKSNIEATTTSQYLAKKHKNTEGVLVIKKAMR